MAKWSVPCTGTTCHTARCDGQCGTAATEAGLSGTGASADGATCFPHVPQANSGQRLFRAKLPISGATCASAPTQAFGLLAPNRAPVPLAPTQAWTFGAKKDCRAARGHVPLLGSRFPAASHPRPPFQPPLRCTPSPARLCSAVAAVVSPFGIRGHALSARTNSPAASANSTAAATTVTILGTSPAPSASPHSLQGGASPLSPQPSPAPLPLTSLPPLLSPPSPDMPPLPTPPPSPDMPARPITAAAATRQASRRVHGDGTGGRSGGSHRAGSPAGKLCVAIHRSPSCSAHPCTGQLGTGGRFTGLPFTGQNGEEASGGVARSGAQWVGGGSAGGCARPPASRNRRVLGHIRTTAAKPSTAATRAAPTSPSHPRPARSACGRSVARSATYEIKKGSAGGNPVSCNARDGGARAPAAPAAPPASVSAPPVMVLVVCCPA
eukprot:scaffold7395_cov95-Isochrysis_galbana.AAC.4